MKTYHVDMAAPDPTHEAAYFRVKKVIQENRPFLDALVKANPSKISKNWKVEIIKKSPDILLLRNLWQDNVLFQRYLTEKMESHFGRLYTGAMIRIFIK